nr:MAG TPA: hypothetical protein [Caudoviricetes sp.]
MATSASEWEKKWQRDKDTAKAGVNQTYNTSSEAAEGWLKTVKDNAAQARDAELDRQNREYRDRHDLAAAQEFLNRRKTNEAMANSGLSDSGLNRTQQTAISIARGNQDAALTRQQQDARDATFAAYDDLVAKHEAELAEKKFANEQARQAALLEIDNDYDNKVAAMYKAEAEAKQAAAKQAAENQKMLQDAYLAILKQTNGDTAQADQLMQKLYGVSLSGGQAQTGTGATAKTYTTTDGSTVNTPFSQMTFKKTKNTWNGPAGLGSLLNAIGGGNVEKGAVKQGTLGNVDWNDEFYLDGSYFADGKGRTMTTSAIEKELLNEGLSKAEARRMLLELTNLKESDTYTDGKTADYKLNDLQKKVSGGQMDQMDAAEEIMKMYSNSPATQIEALMSIGMSRAGAQAAQRAYTTYMQY